MASTLGITARNPDARTFAGCHGETEFLARFVDFEALDAGAGSVCFAGVVGTFVVEELEVFEVVCPYGEGSGSDGFSVIAFGKFFSVHEMVVLVEKRTLTRARCSVSQAGYYVPWRTRYP